MHASSKKIKRRGNIVHHVPGRLRIKIMDAHTEPDFFIQIKNAISVIPGVDSVRVSVPSSSIVIDYVASDAVFHFRLLEDPEVSSRISFVTQTSIIKSQLERTLSESALYPEQHSRIAESVVSLIEDFDVRLRQASNGYLDLKVLIPLGIAIGTSLNKARGRGTPMWMTLGTFAFNSFVTFHHQRIDMPIVQIFSRKGRRV